MEEYAGAQFVGIDLHRRRSVIVRMTEAGQLNHIGSAPIAEPTLRRAVAVFGCDVVVGYGMTEASAGTSAMTPRYAPGLDRRTRAAALCGGARSPARRSGSWTGRRRMSTPYPNTQPPGARQARTPPGRSLSIYGFCTAFSACDERIG